MFELCNSIKTVTRQIILLNLEVLKENNQKNFIFIATLTLKPNLVS